MTEPLPPEFSRPFNAERVQDAPRTEKITANKEECTALIKRLGIIDVKSLSAEMTISRLPDAMSVIDISGIVRATVVQSSVVTLEPVEQKVEETFDTLFASEKYVERWLRDNPHDEYEAPEALVNGWLDLGELATQYLALALDPYPREPGLPLMGSDVEEETMAKVNPFAILAKLKRD